MLTVLISRPLEASQLLADQLALPGVQGLVMPFYTFEGKKPDVDVAAMLKGCKRRQLIVFTSPRAVEFGLPYIPADQRAGLEFATVGDATRHTLEDAGVKVNWQPAHGYTSEDLLAVLDLQTNPGTAVVMCAPDGRGVLKPGLEALGWAASNAMVYQRKWTLPTTDQISKIVDAEHLLTVWTSTSALIGAHKNLPAMAWSKILSSPALVISERIKHHLQYQGASNIGIADGPGNADLLQSITAFVKHHHSL